MSESQQKFWNEWAETYQGFSETVEPYREAQRALARSMVVVLGEGIHSEALTLIDVGGGAGNSISPNLEAIAARRGNLTKVTYVLTDISEAMIALANERQSELRRSYPEVEFRIVHTDTLGENYTEIIGQGLADMVVSSWNIEYYSPEKRYEKVTKLAHLVCESGVVAFSSIVRLPANLTIRDVLMPLGRAQVVHALLTGDPRRMRKMTTGLKQIAQFGAAAANGQFPEKPTLTELELLARRAELGTILSEYQLYGASGTVVARKDTATIPALPTSPIAKRLVGKDGYEGYTEAVTFWGYLQLLLRDGQ